MYADVVLGLKSKTSMPVRIRSKRSSNRKKSRRGARYDTDLAAEDLEALVKEYKARDRIKTWQRSFPKNPIEQLWGAIGAVFGSWNNDRAIAYRELYQIPHRWGTAINVQAMVFGNLGDDCATGVAFTRDPSTGEKRFYGEFLVNAQGEDVVAGIRTPKPIAEFKQVMPKAFGRSSGAFANLLEKHYRDMQDIEFTIENGSSGCCKPAPASVPASLRCASPWIWSANGSSPERGIAAS